MFGFKKKKEEPRKEAAAENQSQEYQVFAADFLPEETEILAVTGASGLDGERTDGSELRHVSIGLTAWMDNYTKELRQEEATLEAMVEEKLLDYLRTRVTRDSILEVTVRPSADGMRFLMTGLPKPGYDPELKALLEKQKAPVSLPVEGLGVFTLNRALGWFETAVTWMETEVSLAFDQAEEGRDAAQETARTLLDGQATWDAQVRTYAASELLDQANGQDGAAASERVTREDFLAQLEPEFILAAPEGAFEFWFSGGALFPGHAIHVTGTLAQGPLQAEVEE